MRPFYACITFMAFLMLGACNMDDDRFEQISKLRAIGVSSVPVIAQPSISESTPSVSTLTFYAVLPLQASVSVEPYTDTQVSGSLAVPVEVIAGSEKYQDFASFRLFTCEARVVLPPVSKVIIPPKPGFIRIKYGLLLKSNGEEEKVVGNLIVYPPGSQELSWQAPSVDIASPMPNQDLSGAIEIKANLTAPNEGDKLRVGWYVSSGKVQNRRAKDTMWEEAKSGTQTLMITARGLKSGAFAPPKIIDVQIP